MKKTAYQTKEAKAERPLVYKFVGEGAGVPLLPHVITMEDAERLGVRHILEAAIQNGNYQAVEE